MILIEKRAERELQVQMRSAMITVIESKARTQVEMEIAIVTALGAVAANVLGHEMAGNRKVFENIRNTGTVTEIAQTEQKAKIEIAIATVPNSETVTEIEIGTETQAEIKIATVPNTETATEIVIETVKTGENVLRGPMPTRRRTLVREVRSEWTRTTAHAKVRADDMEVSRRLDRRSDLEGDLATSDAARRRSLSMRHARVPRRASRRTAAKAVAVADPEIAQRRSRRRHRAIRKAGRCQRQRRRRVIRTQRPRASVRETGHRGAEARAGNGAN